MSGVGPSMTSPVKTPAWAEAGANSAMTRGMRVRGFMRGTGSQPGRSAGVSGSVRTGRQRVGRQTFGSGLRAPVIHGGGPRRLVPPELASEGGGDALGRAVVELARGQEAQPRAAQQDVADRCRLLAARGEGRLGQEVGQPGDDRLGELATGP